MNAKQGNNIQYSHSLANSAFCFLKPYILSQQFVMDSQGYDIVDKFNGDCNTNEPPLSPPFITAILGLFRKSGQQTGFDESGQHCLITFETVEVSCEQ